MTTLIGLSAIANRIRLQYPILLVIVGVVIGFVPFLPNLELNPEIVFLVFLPPLLYDAASKTSWHDFRRELGPISTLAISLVFFTTVSVAVTTYFLVPGFTWPLAFVLGAIVSPPDAVAASGITKGLGLNRRVITIIEGESLVNDASALIAYRYALGAVISGSFILWKASLAFLWIAAGGIALGLVIGFVFVYVHKHIRDNAVVETSLSLLTPYVAYLAAERFHMSGILAVVVAGLYVSWKSREVFSSHTRIQTTLVWDTLIFLLNGIIFILIGLQMPATIQDLQADTVTGLIGDGLIISVVTIIIRIIWVFAGAYHRNYFRRKSNVDETPVSWKNVLIVAWTGTRGVVSLATAMALPVALGDGSPFPKRHSILLLAFVVIIVTLVVQGLTLPLLIKWLKIPPVKDLQKQEEANLQMTVSKKILYYLDHGFPLQLDEKAIKQVRRQHELIINMLSANDKDRYRFARDSGQLDYISQVLSAQVEILKFQRELLIGFHKDGTFNDETITKAERELDIEELRLEAMLEKGEDTVEIKSAE